MRATSECDAVGWGGCSVLLIVWSSDCQAGKSSFSIVRLRLALSLLRRQFAQLAAAAADAAAATDTTATAAVILEKT